MNLRNRKRSEDTEQIQVMEWLYHIPNGGTRDSREAIKLKRMGVKRGVSDIHLPFPHGRYHSLYIEMKYGRNVATQEQIQFMRDMVDAGHCVAVCHDAQSAIELIEQYVNLPAMGRIKVNELEEKNVYWDEDFICHIASCSAY